MVRYIVEIDCDRYFAEEVNAFDSYLSELGYRFVLHFSVVRRIAFLTRHSHSNAVDTMFLVWLIDLGHYDLIKV